MAREGMVHALEEIHRLLRSDGMLIDIHPIPEGYMIQAIQADRILFSERKRHTCSQDVLHAERALVDVIERNLYAVDRRAEFDFLTYASSVQEMRNYWEEVNAFDDEPEDEAVQARVNALYDQVEEILQNSKVGAEVAIHERVRIAKLIPVR